MTALDQLATRSIRRLGEACHRTILFDLSSQEEYREPVLGYQADKPDSFVKNLHFAAFGRLLCKKLTDMNGIFHRPCSWEVGAAYHVLLKPQPLSPFASPPVKFQTVLALDIFDEYLAWLRANVPLAYENLAPPAAPSELAALEEAIEHDLPASVKAVLGVHNGQKAMLTASRGEHGVPCIPTLNFLSTTAIRQRWDIWTGIRHDPNIDILQRGGGVRLGAEGLIKPLYTSAGWIPLWTDPMRDDYIGLDLDPASGGKAGQIINFGRNEERHFLCASNFTGLLQILLEEVRSGAWQASQLRDDEYEDDDDFNDYEALPWFGGSDQHFFNALYFRFADGLKRA